MNERAFPKITRIEAEPCGPGLYLPRVHYRLGMSRLANYIGGPCQHDEALQRASAFAHSLKQTPWQRCHGGEWEPLD